MSCAIHFVLTWWILYLQCLFWLLCLQRIWKIEELIQWWYNNWERTGNKQMPENSQSSIIDVKFTPKGVEVEKSIWECFLLDTTRDDIITPVKVQEEVKSKVQKTEVHTTINSGTVLCQSTLYIAECNCRWHNPI